MYEKAYVSTQNIFLSRRNTELLKRKFEKIWKLLDSEACKCID